MSKRQLLVAGVVLALVAVGCRRDRSEENNPASIGPSSTGLGGTWTGSLSRPGALGPIAVRWEGDHQGQNLTGPATFTHNGVSVVGRIDGNIAGSPAMWFPEISFADPALPNCRAGRSQAIAGPGATVQNLMTTATTMTSEPFGIRYTDCQTFIGAAIVDEMTQLTLNKQ